jgi:hypothetical protein
MGLNVNAMMSTPFAQIVNAPLAGITPQGGDLWFLIGDVWQKRYLTSAFDCRHKLPLVCRAHSRRAARQNFASLGHKTAEP